MHLTFIYKEIDFMKTSKHSLIIKFEIVKAIACTSLSYSSNKIYIIR